MSNKDDLKPTYTPKVLSGSFTFAAALVILVIATYMKTDKDKQGKIRDLQEQIDDLTLQINHEIRDSLDVCGLWQTRVDYDIQMYSDAIAKFNANTSLATQAEYYKKLCEAREKREEIRNIGEYFTKKYQPKMDSLRFEQRKLQEKKL